MVRLAIKNDYSRYLFLQKNAKESGVLRWVLIQTSNSDEKHAWGVRFPLRAFDIMGICLETGMLKLMSRISTLRRLWEDKLWHLRDILPSSHRSYKYSEIQPLSWREAWWGYLCKFSATSLSFCPGLGCLGRGRVFLNFTEVKEHFRTMHQNTPTGM